MLMANLGGNQIPGEREKKFRRDSVVGAAAKEIVGGMLETCGYEVHPFGFESSLAAVRHWLSKSNLRTQPLGYHIRSMPDLLVLGNDELHLVEVKFNKGWQEADRMGVRLKNGPLRNYRDYWPESVLVILSPYGERFFAQSVTDLEPRGEPEEETFFEFARFEPITSIFRNARHADLGMCAVAIDRLEDFWKPDRESG
jgi:hypothetical protein